MWKCIMRHFGGNGVFVGLEGTNMLVMEAGDRTYEGLVEEGLF